MANLLSLNNLETIASVINGRIDADITMLNAQATEVSRRMDNCYTKNETNRVISSAQKVFITANVPTSDSPVGMYYVGTGQPYESYLVDSSGTVTAMGVADVDLTDYQTKQSADLTTNSKVVVEAINELKSSILASNFPVGMITPYAGSTAPDGWLLCDGSSYKWFLNAAATKYYNLYQVIGLTYGGSGENFKVPNLKGKFIEGASTTSGHTLGSSVGSALPTPNLQFSGTPLKAEDNYFVIDKAGWVGNNGELGVAKGVFSKSRNKSYAGNNAGSSNTYGTQISFAYTPAGSVSLKSTETIYGKSTVVQPASICMNYIIRYE